MHRSQAAQQKSTTTPSLGSGRAIVASLVKLKAYGNVLYPLLTVAFVERQFFPTHATPRSYKVSELYAPVTRLGFPGAAIHLPTS
jgi:hypothetical protein